MRYTLCDPPPTGAWTPEEWKAFWQKALDQQNPIPPGYIPPEEITVAKRLYRIGWTAAALARAMGVEAATLALYLKDRRAMMLWWGDHLDKLRKGADVIPLQPRSA